MSLARPCFILMQIRLTQIWDYSVLTHLCYFSNGPTACLNCLPDIAKITSFRFAPHPTGWAYHSGPTLAISILFFFICGAVRANRFKPDPLKIGNNDLLP